MALHLEDSIHRMSSPSPHSPSPPCPLPPLPFLLPFPPPIPFPPTGSNSMPGSRSTTAPAIVDYLHALGHLALLCLQLLHGGAGQHARLRRRRPDAAQSGDRRRSRRTAPGLPPCAPGAWATSSTWCRTTWGSPGRRTRGGRTCWKTAPAPATRRCSISTGQPLKPELEQKVLLPVLGDTYGAVLERQEIRLEYENGRVPRQVLRPRLSDRSGHLRPDSGPRQAGSCWTTSARTRKRASSFSAS